MAQEGSDPFERWTAKRRVALVVSILKGETSAAEADRTSGLTVAEALGYRSPVQYRAQQSTQVA